ncbi:MAG: flavocytochrome c [Deltaproteobacteria bacterium]|nr:flavocytochrome c [Deltaproteobacteria bacterium]
MTKWDEQKDVIIIGSGVAGLSAAIEASGAGASVIVLEKMKVTGGNTRISDGGVAAPNNYLQERRGIEDSPELFYDDMLKAGSGLNHPHLVKIVAEKAAGAIEWTMDTLGVQYQDRLDRFGGHSVARCLTTKSHSGADLIKAQISLLKQKGVEIRTRCMLTRLQTDSKGFVCGVQIRSGYKFPDGSSGVLKNIQAGRSVILATGGFGNDVQFRMLQNPGLDETLGSTNHRGATAEGLIAALELKAAPVHLSWIQMGPWGCPDEKGYGRGARFASYGVYPTGIVVDPGTGRRIVNEWGDRRQRCDAILKTGHPCVGIVDALGAKTDAESLGHCLERGHIKSFDTLTELASKFKMPEGQLEMTTKNYNHLIKEGGQDPFGKPLARGANPLAKPPYYAILLWPKVHYTPGGVGINPKAQVINLNNRPVPRLFAAGEVCGGIHGAGRLGSCALTECIVFGRIAGQQAAAVNPGSNA